MRALKGLQDHIGVSVVHPHMLESGWELDDGFAGATGDALYGFSKLYELYLKADSHYTGRVTVPVLWDTQRETIVSNESADIIRMLNTSFDALGATPGNYYPQALRADIDAINERVYHDVNNGVYKSGFATSQQAYDEAVVTLFDRLEELEQRLGESRYLVGNTLTEADIRLWTTLVRFDPVYVTHFKCDRKRISDYPNLQGFLQELYQLPGVADTVNMAHIRHHYFCSHPTVNPHGIISIGPQLDWTSPHGRERLGERKISG
jgi:putative glutathione S-transferase